MATQVEKDKLPTRNRGRRISASAEVQPLVLVSDPSGGTQIQAPPAGTRLVTLDVESPDDPQVQATQLLGNIPFEALIGGPLVAAVRAQGMAANETLNYIFDVLYGNQSSGNSSEEVLTVNITYQKSVAGAPTETATMIVPLLILVPIPYLHIDTMTITFKAQINASTQFNSKDTNSWQQHTTTSDNVSGSFFGLFGGGTNTTSSYSSKGSSTASSKSIYSVEYNLDVYVHVTGEDMPAGTQKVLNILTSSITSTGGSS